MSASPTLTRPRGAARSRSLSTAVAVARRNVHTSLVTPSLLLPPLVAPLIFLLAFTGGLSALGRLPGFDYSPGYATFNLVFVVLQGTMFTGVFTGLSLARDLQSGFTRRLFLATSDRRAILGGYVLAALARAPLTIAVVIATGLGLGAHLDGGLAGLIGLLLLSEALCALAALWAIGVALRIGSVQAAPLMQMPIFLTLYLAPAFVPLQLLSGWIHAVASVNPMGGLLADGRSFLAGGSAGLGHVGLLAAAFLLLALWAARGLRRI